MTIADGFQLADGTGTIGFEEKEADHQTISLMKIKDAPDYVFPLIAARWTIESGDVDNLFKITPNGKIMLSRDASNASGELSDYTLEVSGESLLDNGTFTNVATAKVTINVISTIGIYGDTMAVRNSQDVILLTFARYTKDITSDVTVNFTPTWSAPPGSPYAAASADDLVNDETYYEIFYPHEIVIPAGQTTATLELSAASLQEGESVAGIRVFTVAVTSSTDGHVTYFPVMRDTHLADSDAHTVMSDQTLFILDGVTRFAGLNKIGKLEDHPTDDSNPGIDPNDVSQGGPGDCAFMAAVIALARTDPAKIASLITDNGDGSFRVQLYAGQNVKAPAYTVSGNILSNGFDMAKLSGDYNSSGQVEIWPQLLEAAWAHLSPHDGYQSIDGVGIPEAWGALTGSFTRVDVAAVYTNLQLAKQIYFNFSSGPELIVTKDTPAGTAPLNFAPNKGGLQQNQWVVLA